MAVIRLILGAALLVTALGLIFELFVPGSGRMIDIGAVVFGLATWIVPPLLMALSRNKKRSSLESVGFTIYLLVVAACLSAIGLSLALLTLVFAQDANWGPGSVCWPLRRSGYQGESGSMSVNVAIGGPEKFPSR